MKADEREHTERGGGHAVGSSERAMGGQLQKPKAEVGWREHDISTLVVGLTSGVEPKFLGADISSAGYGASSWAEPNREMPWDDRLVDKRRVTALT